MQNFVRILASTLLLVITTGASAQPISLDFDDETFLHRWSQGDQHEFTPRGQEELSAWEEMLTVIYFPAVRDDEALTGVVKSILGMYQTNGTILGTAFVGPTETSEAERLVVAQLGYGLELEVVFARILLAHGQGVAIVYSKRFGEAASEPLVSAWVEENIQGKMDSILAWSGLPPPEAFSN